MRQLQMEKVGSLACPPASIRLLPFWHYECQSMCRVLAPKILRAGSPGKLPKCQQPVTTVRVACRLWVFMSQAYSKHKIKDLCKRDSSFHVLLKICPITMVPFKKDSPCCSQMGNYMILPI